MTESARRLEEGALRVLVLGCSRVWSGAARTSMPPSTRCRRRCGASQAALTLRAAGGLTTREIADALYVRR